MEWIEQLDERLRHQLGFLLEVDRLKTVIRTNQIGDASRRENTAEHSWHIALFALTLAEYAAQQIDVGRVVQMLLLHDVVEIDAGDTPLHSAEVEDQSERERVAADRLFELLPNDQAQRFRSLWDEYEGAETADAQFAKAVDRLQPVLLNHVGAAGHGPTTTSPVSRSTSAPMELRQGRRPCGRLRTLFLTMPWPRAGCEGRQAMSDPSCQRLAIHPSAMINRCPPS